MDTVFAASVCYLLLMLGVSQIQFDFLASVIFTWFPMRSVLKFVFSKEQVNDQKLSYTLSNQVFFIFLRLLLFFRQYKTNRKYDASIFAGLNF